MKNKKLIAATVALASTMLAPTAIWASEKNVTVAARALGFIEPKLSGSVRAVVFYNKGNSASLAEARSIRTALSKKKVKGASFSVTLASAANTSAASGSKVVFLTRGLKSRHKAIFSAASSARAITISSDLSCVRTNMCVVGVKSSPKTEILVSRSARQKTRVRFSSAFLMLVKEV